MTIDFKKVTDFLDSCWKDLTSLLKQITDGQETSLEAVAQICRAYRESRKKLEDCHKKLEQVIEEHLDKNPPFPSKDEKGETTFASDIRSFFSLISLCMISEQDEENFLYKHGIELPLISNQSLLANPVTEYIEYFQELHDSQERFNRVQPELNFTDYKRYLGYLVTELSKVSTSQDPEQKTVK